MPTASTGAAADSATRRLLVVDDDPEIRSLSQRYLSAQGFQVSLAANGQQMREVLAEEAIDLVLLDLTLPGEDGLDLMRALRSQWQCAVIIVTGRGDAIDRIVGLELGADDYVAKPFELRELLARIRSVLRRTAAVSVAPPAQVEGELYFEGFRLQPGRHCLLDAAGREVSLTSGEFALLLAFVENPQRVFSRDDLMNRIHGRDSGPFDRAIDVQVSRLRRKIEVDPSQPRIIKSIRGSGYMFAARVTADSRGRDA